MKKRKTKYFVEIFLNVCIIYKNMQVSSQSAASVSNLCQRISKMEIAWGIPAVVAPVSHGPQPRQNIMSKVNILCSRVKRLEKKAGIPSVVSTKPHFSLGPSGNALLANKINTLCSRVARIEKTPLPVV